MLRAGSCMSLLLLCVVLDASRGEVWGDAIYYIGPDGGTWHAPGNWSSGRVPDLSDEVRIYNGLTVQITQDVDFDHMRVGYLLDGAVVQESGTASGNVFLGRDDGVNQNRGVYTLAGGELHPASLRLGYSDRDNLFSMNGGMISSSSTPAGIIVGDAVNKWDRPSGSNRFEVNDGTINVFSLAIRAYQSGVNTFVMNHGELALASTLSISSSLSGYPTVTTPGVFTQNGGSVLTSELSMGDMPIYDLNGGTLTISDQILFYSWTDGYLNFQGGVLNLPGTWDFDKLTGISHSEFRVFGGAATEANLVFGAPVFIGPELYTPISAIPEPSTLLLAILSLLSFSVYTWWARRTRTVSPPAA